MLAPISSLANMEMALYGGFGTDMNTPSYVNGYCSHANNMAYPNPYYSAYGMNNQGAYNPTFGQNIPSGYGTQTQQQESIFQGLNASETKALMNDYKKSLAPSEGLFGCVLGNAAFGVLMHPRLIAHPVNSYTTLKNVNKAFADVKVEGSALQKLWKDPKNSDILREAYFQMHKAEARCEKKLGAFRRSYLKTGVDAAGNATSEVSLVQDCIKELKTALNAKGMNPEKQMEEITNATAKLKQAYTVNEGFLARGFNKVKSWFTGSSSKTTVASKLADTVAIDKIKAGLNVTKEFDFKSILKRGGGVKAGLLFAGLELLMNFGKIKTAFQEDSSTGMKQLGQTSIKAAGNAAGWALGEAAGVLAFTKLGASIGTALGPGIGTLIGGVVGLVGGGLGMWLAGKATNAIVGQDVADDIQARKLAQSQEGQVQLLQNTMQRIQSGENVSPEAQMAVQKLIAQYA